MVRGLASQWTYFAGCGAGALPLAFISALKNLPSPVSSKVSQEEIKVGPHSGSKHQTVQPMPLESRYFVISVLYASFSAFEP